MARPRRIDPELVVKARAVVAQATDAKTLRAAQAVLMPALAHTTLEQTAALLGVGRASVPRLQRRFREGLQLVRSSPGETGQPERGDFSRGLVRNQDRSNKIAQFRLTRLSGRAFPTRLSDAPFPTRLSGRAFPTGQNGSGKTGQPELRQSHCVAHRPSTLKNPFLSHHLAPPHFRLKPLAVLSLKAEG